jgi:hypothetical protein
MAMDKHECGAEFPAEKFSGQQRSKTTKFYSTKRFLQTEKKRAVGITAPSLVIKLDKFTFQYNSIYEIFQVFWEYMDILGRLIKR